MEVFDGKRGFAEGKKEHEATQEYDHHDLSTEDAEEPIIRDDMRIRRSAQRRKSAKV